MNRSNVTVLNQGTDISTRVSTKSDGQYTVTNIKPGSYRVTATSPGFTEKSIRDITVFVNRTVRVDVNLEVGAVSTRTEVEATAPVVQSETSSIGQVVDSRQVTKMPLDGRGNLSGLLALTPGVMSTGQNPLVSGGVWFGSTNLSIDGVSDIDTGNERRNKLFLLFAGLSPITDPATGAPFPGNQIPAGRISPVAQGLLKFTSEPNLPGARVDVRQSATRSRFVDGRRRRIAYSGTALGESAGKRKRQGLAHARLAS